MHNEVGHGRRSKAKPVPDNDTLFQVIMFHDNALDSTTKDWVRSLETTPHEAVYQLIQFVLRAAGCPGQASVLSLDHIRDPDGISEVLEELQSSFDPVTPFLPTLLDNNSDKKELI